jgi:DNA-binding MarR family transcriptional regulator
MGKDTGERMGLAPALVRTAFLVDAVYAESGRDFGLTPQQGGLLCVLLNGPLGMGELGSTLGLAKSSLTGLVDRVAQRGLVRREPDPDDARAVRVALTEKGAELTEEFYVETCRRMEVLANGLDEADRDTLAALLARVVRDNDVPVVFMEVDTSFAPHRA